MARDVRVAILGDSRDFQRAVDSAERDAGRFDGATQRMGGAAKAMGAIIASGVAVGAVAVGKLAIDSISAASDLEESLSKSNAVFGQQGAAMERWADGAAEGFGQSKREALDAAGAFGNMFVQLGIGTMEAAHMSASMTELASDFASFHNADISEVLNAQQAAFRGEYDAVQRFVPTINAAAVEQKALEMGLAETTKELDQQDKALATQQLLLEGAGDAMGDFDRTSDSLANRQRVLSARFEDVKAKIGAGLMPIAVAFADFVATRLLPLLEEWGPRFVDGIGRVSAVVSEHWPQIQEAISTAIEIVRGVIEDFIGYATGAWDTFGGEIVRYMTESWDNIKGIVEGAMQFIEGVVNTVMGFIRGDWGLAWDGIKGIVSGAIGVIQGVIQQGFNVARYLATLPLIALRDFVSGAFDDIAGFVTGMPQRISSAASGMWDGIKNAFRSAINWIIRSWNNLEFRIPGFDPPGPGPTFGGFTLGVPDIPTLHAGGMFRSPSGMDEGYALLKDGERVLSPAQSRSSGGGMSGDLVLRIGEYEFGRIALNALTQYERTNGPLPLRMA